MADKPQYLTDEQLGIGKGDNEQAPKQYLKESDLGIAPEQDGAFMRGLKTAGQSIKMTGQLTAGDAAGVAQSVKEAELYRQKNPGTKEGDELAKAWDSGEKDTLKGVLQGAVGVGKEFVKDWNEADGFVGGLRATGKNLEAMRQGIVSQAGNSIAPMVGLAAGAAAGGAAGSAAPIVGNAAGAVAGGWAGASLGNTLVEGGGQVQDALQKAGIDPLDTPAVEKFIAENGDRILGKSAIKGGIIGAVDAATMKLGGSILSKPIDAAMNRAFAILGIDAADKVAVNAAIQSGEIARHVAADPIYQASQKGLSKLAREGTVAALDPAGEFTGEYVGQGVATGDWDTKNAALEALSSVGQSGIMYAGQKGYQYATNPLRGSGTANQNSGTATPAAPGHPLQLGNSPDPLIQFRDGTVARQSEIDAHLASLPESERQTFVAQILGYAPQQADEPQLTTSPGATQFDGVATEQPSESVAAPDFGTSLGAQPEPQGGGLEFQRQIDTSGLNLERLDSPFAQPVPATALDRQALARQGAYPTSPTPAPVLDTRRLSEQLGLSSNNGGLESAAAYAVDSGATPIAQALNSQPTGVVNGAQAQEAQQAVAGQSQGAGAQERVAAAPKIRAVKLKDGTTAHVNEADLTSGASQLRTFTADGKPRAARLQAAHIAPAAPKVVLQNRNRATPASIDQMNAIAGKPDFLRTGASNTMDNGAPIVFGDLPQKVAIGRAQMVADGNGQRVPTQYAVVEAQDLITSNHADGSPVAEYANGVDGKLRAVAGNGRAAGLKAAWQRGTAGQYGQELVQDAPNLGIAPDVLAQFEAPVLVRVMDAADVTPDMGDRSNVQAGLQMSAVEQASNDAQRLNLRDMEFNELGNPTAQTVMRFMQGMPVQERGNMLDSQGRATSQLLDRIRAAAFKQAYMSDSLVELAAQSADPEAKNILNGLAIVAGDMAQLAGAGDFDIRQTVTDAASMAVTAGRTGQSIAQYLQTRQIDENPETVVVMQFMAQNVRSAKRIADGLRAWAELAQGQIAIARQNAEQDTMFGDTPTLSRRELFERLNNDNLTEIEQQQLIEQQRRAELTKQGTQRPGTERAGNADGASDGAESRGTEPTNAQDAGREQADFALAQQTPEQIRAQEEAQAQAARDKAKEDARAAEAERKAVERQEVTQRSEAAANDFQLGQSAEDNLSGRQDIFAQQQEATPEAPPKTLKEGFERVRAKKAAEKAEKTANEVPVGASGEQANDFQLGQSAEDNLSGQQDIFAASSQETATTPKTEPQKPKTVIEKMKDARAKKEANTFIESPNGGLDYGEITPDMAKAMRRQAGKIRLQQGVQNADGTGWGLAHIEANHGEQIRGAGFETVQAFIQHIAGSFNEVLQATKGRQLLVAMSAGRKDVMFIQLEPAETGDFYRINTAFAASRDYLEKQEGKGAKVLWSGSEPRTTSTRQKSQYADNSDVQSGQSAPIAEAENYGASVAQTEQGGKLDSNGLAKDGQVIDPGQLPMSAIVETAKGEKFIVSSGRHGVLSGQPFTRGTRPEMSGDVAVHFATDPVSKLRNPHLRNEPLYFRGERYDGNWRTQATEQANKPKPKVSVLNGNKTVEISVVGQREWASGDNSRIYYDLEQSNKRSVVHSLYEVIAGKTKDDTISVDGRTFGYQLGIDTNSHTKRAEAEEGIEALVGQLVASKTNQEAKDVLFSATGDGAANLRTKPKGATTSTIRHAASRAYGKLLDRLEAKGLVHVAQTEEDALQAAAKARAAKTGQSVAQELNGLRQSVQNSIAVWHGTPHRGIERTGFKLNKIGTGAAAQTYGWGIYFASQRVVAEGYRETLTGLHAHRGSETINAAGERLWQRFYDRNSRGEKAVVWQGAGAFEAYTKEEFLKNWLSRPSVTNSPEYKEEIGKALKGQLYGLDLPVEESDLLDWDKPLSEQSPKVREALAPLIEQVRDTKRFSDDPTGERICNALSVRLAEGDAPGKLGRGAKAASEALLRAGIPGLRYLDGNSRADGKGSHNYVIWDEALLTTEAAQIDAKFSKDGAIEGFFDRQTGKSFLVADGLTEETAPATLMHEVGIHMAADGSMQGVFNRAAMLVKNSKDEFMNRVRDRMEAAGETSAEEAAAYIVTEYEKDRTNAPASIKQFMKDFLAAVRAWLFRNGFTQVVKEGNLTPADISAIARANARSLANGAEAVTVGDGARMSRSPSTQAAQNTADSRASTAAQNPSNPSQVWAAIEGVFEGIDGLRQRLDAGTTVVRSADELPQQFQQAAKDAQAQGFYDDKSKRIYLVADRIEAGQEKAVWLHEVFHKRGKELLGNALPRLHQAVQRWASRQKNSVERQIYEAAHERATNDGNYEAEFLAYAIEEAVNRGVQPDLKANIASAGYWLGRVREAFSKVIAKLTGVDVAANAINAKDLVTAAYGSAGLEVAENTAARQAGRAQRKNINSQSTTGHAQPLDEPVLTPSGWRSIGELQVGDEVYAHDGSITQITGVYPQGVQDVFRVELDDGRFTRATTDHLWQLAVDEGGAVTIATTKGLAIGDALPVV